jgi:hypothetical protein
MIQAAGKKGGAPILVHPFFIARTVLLLIWLLIDDHDLCE